MTWLRQWQSPRGPPVGKAAGLGCAWLDGPDPPGGRREKANFSVDVTPLASISTSGMDVTSCPDVSVDVAASMSVVVAGIVITKTSDSTVKTRHHLFTAAHVIGPVSK